MSTSRSCWKGAERKIARLFGTERNPLSGGSGKHSRSDTLHERFFIEVKLRNGVPLIDLYYETEELAKKEGKHPIVVIFKKGNGTPFLFTPLRSSNLFIIAEAVLKGEMKLGPMDIADVK